ALQSFDSLDAERVFTALSMPGERSLVFMFPGGGAQYVNMGSQLYEVEATFRHYVDRCAVILQPHLRLDLRTLLYPVAELHGEAEKELLKPSFGLPALFVISYSLAQLWLSWRVQPTAMIGHSLGEYVAACLAGVFSLEDALALVVLRGRLFEHLPEGAMLSVPLAYAEIEPLLSDQLSLAAINSPSQCVISGATNALVELQTLLQARGIQARRVHIAVAAHSHMVNAILPEFTQFLQKLQLHAPTLPYISNVTGTWITAEEAVDPHYWARHLRQTVRFAAGIETVLQAGYLRFLEVGPGQTLSALVRQHPAKSTRHLVLSSTRHPKMPYADLGYLLTAIGRLWLSGLPIHWASFYQGEQRQRLPLPTTPFERHHYWIEKEYISPQLQKPSASLQRNSDLATWGYQPSWKRSFLLTTWAAGKQRRVDALCWLIYLDKSGLGADLIEHLQARGQRIVTVQASDHFCCLRPLAYALHPEREEDYERLLAELSAADLLPERIIHLWNVTPH
ncbi:MAG: acyltransferase domain-containing protein, partial [Ktedonobacteraceae bacterium]